MLKNKLYTNYDDIENKDDGMTKKNKMMVMMMIMMMTMMTQPA